MTHRQSMRNSLSGVVDHAVRGLLGLLTVVLLALDAELARAEAAASVPSFAYSRAPADLIARIRIRAGEIRGHAPRTASVYGDGRVVVELPAGYRWAGRHETRLSAGELAALVGELVESRLPDFDPAAVRAACRDRESTRGDVVSVSDADIVEIELNLDAYRRTPTSPAAALHKSVTWRALSQEAARFPEVTQLADLVAVRDALAGLMARPDLEPVR